MGAPLKTPPVYYTVAQVRFNPVLKLLEYLPGIQEGMRKSGFADYQVHKAVVLQMATTPDGQVAPVPVTVDRYSFGNSAKTHNFLLDNDKLTLQSTSYGRFEEFLDVFLKGLALVHGSVTLDYIERVGLRYLDRVMPGSGESLEQYLEPGVLGLRSHLVGRSLHFFSEALHQVGQFKLMSRVVVQDGPLAFPPDVQPVGLTVAERFVAYAGGHAILDNDGFFEDREPYSLDKVTEHLGGIHKVIADAFVATTTKFARQTWNT